MRKKIGIDFTYIKKDEVSGIRKSGEELLDGLTRINNKYEIVLFIDSDLEKSFNKKYPQYKKISIKVPFKKNRYLRAFYNRTIDKYYKKYCIKKEKCDLMLYPYVDAMSPTSKKIVSLQSILDIIPLDIIENKKSFRYIRKKRQYINMMNKTNNIVTISKYSKDRLLDINPKYDGNILLFQHQLKN